MPQLSLLLLRVAVARSFPRQEATAARPCFLLKANWVGSAHVRVDLCGADPAVVVCWCEQSTGADNGGLGAAFSGPGELCWGAPL